MSYSSVSLMIARIVASASLLLGVAAGGDVPPHVQAPAGPLGHWRADDAASSKAAADASGNGFHGTYSAAGATIAAAAAGTKFPNPGCLTLDGAAGVVTVPDSPALRFTGDFALSFWRRKTANVKDWARIVGKGNGAQRNYGVWEAPEGDGKILFQMYGPGGQSVIDLFSPAPLPINTWQHVVVSVSVNSVGMYINGALVANGMKNAEPGTSADPLTFGHAGFHTFWAGQLDDVRIYNRALSMSEIVYLAQGNGGPAAPTGLASAVAAPKQVELKWTASTTVPPAGTGTYYILKRSTTPGTGYAVVASSLSGTVFTDAKADAGATYYYVVTAVNTGGESDPSNEVKVAVPAN